MMLKKGLETDDFSCICPEISVLNLGCGTSSLAQEMFERDKFTQVWNIDLSPICIR